MLASACDFQIKAQGFKSRGGRHVRGFSLLASPSVQDFQQLSVVFVLPTLPPLRLLFVLGDCVDYWWNGTTRASDSAVLSRCCMVPACATRRMRSAICGRSSLFVFDQLYIALFFYFSVSVKLKLSRLSIRRAAQI